MNVDEMMRQAKQPWLPGQKLPLHKWLVDSQSEQDKSRLQAIGNVVIPRCGRLGAHLLEHSLRTDPHL